MFVECISQLWFPISSGKFYLITLQPYLKSKSFARWQTSCGPAKDVLARFFKHFLLTKELNKKGNAHYHALVFGSIIAIRKAKLKLSVHIKPLRRDLIKIPIPSVRRVDPSKWPVHTINDFNRIQVFQWTIEHIDRVHRLKNHRERKIRKNDNSSFSTSYWQFAVRDVEKYITKDLNKSSKKFTNYYFQ